MFNLISPSQMAQLVAAIIAKYGGEAQAHSGLGHTAGYLNPYVDQENRPNFLYGTGFLGMEASKQAVKYLNEKYGYTPGKGAGPKPYSMEEQKNATMYAYQNLLMKELQGKNATPNRDRLNQQGNMVDLENLFNQFFGSGQLPGFGFQSGSEDQQFGYSPEKYQALINAYAQTFANPNTMAAGISSLGPEYYNPYTKPTGSYGGLSFGTDLTHAVSQHPMFQGMVQEMGRGGFNDYLTSNFSPEEIQQLSSEVYFNSMAQALRNKQTGPRSIVGGMLSSFING